MKTASIFSGRHHDINFSNILNATDISFSSLNVNNTKDVDIEILSTEVIKPASPTPHHLKTFNLSLIDQVVFDVYIPLIVFLPNAGKASLTDVMTKRSRNLKETLSEVLTVFYMLAGKVKDNLHIECNDEGVYYMEARVNQTLEEFLSHQDDERLRPLMPKSPHNGETSKGNYVMGVQVNIFNCGGIGLSTSMSHKITDFHAYMIFMRAWAAAIRGSPETIAPNFMASDVFPNDPLIGCSIPPKFTAAKVLTTKRFVFSSTSLGELRSQTIPGTSRGPTRTEAITAVVWKAAAKAASKVRPFSPQSPHAVLTVVNLRKRASPPLPDNTFGNVISVACSMCFPADNNLLELPNLMGGLRESISKVDSDFIESFKGEKGSVAMKETLTQLNHLADVTEIGDCMLTSSVLNMGIYDLDFGWGKPIWFYYMHIGISRLLALVDTPKGDGIEAMVTLSPQEMEIFEQDPHLLSYATLNPSIL